ncbi:hypothetical protein [Amycolatopsis coloradensis]|uniref:hypothetical protein n=1 Tax=Amycolatopsis coloradensis TaxID=76021 RepID=UPI001178B20E|nr:hypothetical protein [Amycolatopsis coloradensis]
MVNDERSTSENEAPEASLTRSCTASFWPADLVTDTWQWIADTRLATSAECRPWGAVNDGSEAATA